MFYFVSMLNVTLLFLCYTPYPYIVIIWVCFVLNFFLFIIITFVEKEISTVLVFYATLRIELMPPYIYTLTLS